MSTEKRQYTKKSDYWKQSAVNKAALSPSKQAEKEKSLLLSPEIGTIGLNSIKAFTNFMQPYETRFPENIRTYKEMGEDPDVATALDATYIFVDRAFFDFKIKYNVNSAKSRKAAKFIEYMLRNMQAPLRQYVRSLLTYKQFGFAFAEKVFELDEDPKSPYYGYYRLTKLAFRPQDTLDMANPFTYSDDGRTVISVNQNITNTMLAPGNSKLQLGVRQIPMNKVIFVGSNITENNPLGVSPLLAVYRSWREKSLIQEFEVIGVSKDLGGMPVLKVPSDILNRASLDPAGDEAQSLRVLQANIANLHSGEQAYMVLPSDVYEGTVMRQYDLVFQGVEGAGKQFDTQELIKQRKLDIYNRFGAGVLIMGDGDAGSFALSDNKQTLLSHFIERDVDIVVEAINSQLIPQALRLNNIFLSDEDMPKFVSGEMGDPDIEVNAKAIQQIVAAGAIPLTAEIINEFLEKLGFDYRIPDDIVSDKDKFVEYMETFMPDKTSRSGDGMATAGTGTSTSVSALDPSAANLSN
ncbi:hypothetical protein MOO17_11760 [Escherichia coli]|uniref:phage portal protein family protein n=1 Tax=Escherichia coli TaxID=562 RepID=UPI001FF2FE5C|nr:hypothetical protein [Escherichia coli]MCJ8478707.1 hypothetical protein [Escherichia coli]